jgi:hypothetical protein
MNDAEREQSITELGRVMREYMRNAESDPLNYVYWRDQARRVCGLMTQTILARSPAAVRRMEIERGLA